MPRIRKWVVTAGLFMLCLSLAVAQDQAKKHGAAAADGASTDQATLDKLDVVHGRQDISIEITASTAVTPKVTTLTEPDRVVLDFPNTVPGTETRRIAVDREGVKSVRMGVNGEVPPTTRVVIDLEQAREYQLVPQANRVIVKFRNAPVAASNESKPSPAVVPVVKSSAETSVAKPATRDTRSTAVEPKTYASLTPTALAGPSGSQSSSVPPLPSQTGSAATSSPAPAGSAKALTASKAPPTATTSSAASMSPSGATPTNTTAASSAQGGTSGTTNTSKPAVTSSSTPGPTMTQPSSSASTDSPNSQASTKPVTPAQTTTIASAQPPAAADPAPANVPEASKDEKARPAPEMKKADYDPKTYIIGEQDVLGIDVWKEKDISQTVVVRPDGKITIPLVDEVYVVGLTPLQLQSLLEEKLKPFLTVPQVTVIVKEISSRKVYLMGQVGRTGPFLINSTTTVLQLIAQAGGLRDFAKRKKIYIMRSENGKTEQFRFNYDEVIKGKRLEQNIVLRPGDTIVVP
jgi:polysaccharide biosynthesis/export protein